MQTVAYVAHTIIFGFIAVTGDLIGFNSLVYYESLADYAYLVIQRVANEMVIDLDA